MSIAETLTRAAKQRQAEAAAAFRAIAERYAAGDEPTPEEVLDVLSAAGKSAEELEREIEAAKKRLAAEAKAIAEADAARVKAEADERLRLSALVLSENETRREIRDVEAKIRRVEGQRDRQIEKLNQQIAEVRRKHNETITTLKQQAADLESRIAGEIAEAREKLLEAADPSLSLKQHQLRLKRRAILERIGEEQEALDAEQFFLEELMRSSIGAADPSLQRRGESIQSHRNTIAGLRAKVADIDAELLTLEAKKFLANPSNEPPPWLIESIQEHLA